MLFRSEKLKETVTGYVPVVLQMMKSLFPYIWNEAQIKANEIDAEAAGFKRGRKLCSGKESLIMLALIVAIPAMALICLVVVLYLLH